MSANIDTMMYVGETPWHGLGAHYEKAPKTSEEIIEGAKLGWTVSSEQMYTEKFGKVPDYHLICRDDTNSPLGVVKQRRVSIVQNSDTFRTVDSMLGGDLDFDTAASLAGGEKVFGCFKIQGRYKLLDDDIDHYFVILNEHLKPDGKVTVLNTPVRVVCQNTLSAALNNNLYRLRVPITTDEGVNNDLVGKLLQSVDSAITHLQKSAEKMFSEKITRDSVELLLDELFPTVGDPTNPESLMSKQNLRIQMMRETFLSECMGADNLQNYRGSNLQIFHALTDFTQHHFAKVDKAYDLDYRMKLLPGMSSDSPANMVTKFLKIRNKLIA